MDRDIIVAEYRKSGGAMLAAVDKEGVSSLVAQELGLYLPGLLYSRSIPSVSNTLVNPHKAAELSFTLLNGDWPPFSLAMPPNLRAAMFDMFTLDGG